MHVHMVANGVGGSGAWLRLSGWHRWLAGFMIRQLGFPANVIDGALEGVYAERLLELIRESSFDAVVLLAHERVHDPDGTPRYCHNTELASSRFVLFERGDAGFEEVGVLSSEGTTHSEWAGRTPAPGEFTPHLSVE